MNFDSYNDPSGKVSNLDFGTSWIYLEWDLSRYNLATENVTDYKFCLCTEIGSSVGDVKTVWLDGITVFSRDEKGFLTGTHTANYSAEIDTETVHGDDEYSVKYTFTKGETGYPTAFASRGTFLNDTAGALFGYDTVNKVTDWSKKVYIGFWIKDPTKSGFNMAVRFANTQDGTNYNGWKETWEMESYRMAPNISSTEEWQYFEMLLSDANEDYYTAIYTENVIGWKLVLATEKGASGSFYIAGLSVYNKAE